MLFINDEEKLVDILTDLATRRSFKMVRGTNLAELGMPGAGFYGGKVREVYWMGPEGIIIASDRISAFDHKIASLIPGQIAIICWTLSLSPLPAA